MLLKIRVKPGSEKVRIRLEENENGPLLKIWLKSQPEKGKANKELSKLLKDVFGEYTFVSGATSREKFINVCNIHNISEKLSKFIKKESRRTIIFIVHHRFSIIFCNLFGVNVFKLFLGF